jgi:hypothetical protein
MNKKRNVKLWTGFQCPRIGFCENGNEPSGSIKHAEFLDQPTNISFSVQSLPLFVTDPG